ncbi:Uncharacterised protein [Wolbachia endosymbiont wPip_Mol of Culex molestus]|nr:Uncharacterised protein [Wolbachia endosymbiont wPip_Mol of Culex molestus]
MGIIFINIIYKKKLGVFFEQWEGLHYFLLKFNILYFYFINYLFICLYIILLKF